MKQYHTMQYHTIQCKIITEYTIQCHTIPYHEIQCKAIPYNAIQYNAKLSNSIQYNAMQYYAKLCKAVKFHWLTGMCGSKAASPRPQQGLGQAGEISGDHILSPHIEAAHRVNVSIVLSSEAISMMLVGVVLYCLIKRKIVRCCVKDSPAHLEQGGNGYNANMAFQHQLGPQLGSQPSPDSTAVPGSPGPLPD